MKRAGFGEERVRSRLAEAVAENMDDDASSRAALNIDRIVEAEEVLCLVGERRDGRVLLNVVLRHCLA